MKRTLLIGGAGFIGRRVAEMLKHRDQEVVVLDLAEMLEGRMMSQIVGAGSCFAGSILDKDFVTQTIRKYQPDTIIHLAGSPTVQSVNQEPEAGFQSIIVGTKNILDSMVSLGSPARLVYISSSMVYGDFKYLPVTESHSANPKNLYGTFKLMAEELVMAYSRIHNLQALIIRPSAVYGPNMTNPNAIVPKFMDISRLGGNLTIHGDGSNAMDFTYVDDLAMGIIAAAQGGKNEEIYNLTYGSGRSIGELVAILEGIYGPLQKNYLPTPDTMPLRGTLDISKAERDFGYAPEFPLEKGLSLIVSKVETYKQPPR